MSRTKKKAANSGYNFWNFWVAYALVAIFLILKFWFPGAIFRDLLNLKSIAARNLFGLYINTTGAFLGILVAAFLLSFQLLGKEQKRRKEGNLLHNRWVIGFSCLSAFLIITSTICYVTIPDFEDNANLSLGYYLLYTFLTFLILIFPVVRVLLNYTNSLTKIQKLISALKIEDFNDAKNSYHNGFWISDNSLKLSVVRTEILYAIRDNDNGGLHTILTDLTERGNALMPAGSNREACESIVKAITILWKDGQVAAAAEIATQFYDIVSNSVQILYQHAAERKIPLLYYRDMRWYFTELAETLARRQDVLSMQKIIVVLESSFKMQLLKSCPRQDSLQELFKLYKRTGGVYDMEAQMQWEDVIDFIGDLSHIQQLSVDNSLKDSYISARRSLIHLLRSLEHGDFPKLGDLQRAYIIMNIIPLGILFNAEKALNAGLFDDSQETYRLDGSLIADILINDPVVSKRILTEIGDHLIKMQRNSKLNEWLTINEFGSIPRHTAKKYHDNEKVKYATKYIFEVFKCMKAEVESNQLPKSVKVYDEIKRQLKAMSLSLEEQEHKGNINLRAEIEQCVEAFKEVNTAPDFNIVGWPKSI